MMTMFMHPEFKKANDLAEKNKAIYAKQLMDKNNSTLAMTKEMEEFTEMKEITKKTRQPEFKKR